MSNTHIEVHHFDREDGTRELRMFRTTGNKMLHGGIPVDPSFKYEVFDWTTSTWDDVTRDYMDGTAFFMEDRWRHANATATFGGVTRLPSVQMDEAARAEREAQDALREAQRKLRELEAAR